MNCPHWNVTLQSFYLEIQVESWIYKAIYFPLKLHLSHYRDHCFMCFVHSAMVVFPTTSLLRPTTSKSSRLSKLLWLMSCWEMKESTKHNKAKQKNKQKKTGKHKHFESLFALINLKRIIVSERRNWPPGKRWNQARSFSKRHF